MYAHMCGTEKAPNAFNCTFPFFALFFCSSLPFSRCINFLQNKKKLFNGFSMLACVWFKGNGLDLGYFCDCCLEAFLSSKVLFSFFLNSFKLFACQKNSQIYTKKAALSCPYHPTADFNTIILVQEAVVAHVLVVCSFFFLENSFSFHRTSSLSHHKCSSHQRKKRKSKREREQKEKFHRQNGFSQKF